MRTVTALKKVSALIEKGYTAEAEAKTQKGRPTDALNKAARKFSLCGAIRRVSKEDENLKNQIVQVLNQAATEVQTYASLEDFTQKVSNKRSTIRLLNRAISKV